MVNTPDLSFKEFILFVLLGMFIFLFIVLSCYLFFRYFYKRKIVCDGFCKCHTEDENYEQIV